MRRLLLASLFALALPAHAYYPEWARTSVLATTELRDLVAADFNGDGIPDVAGRRGTTQVVVSFVDEDAKLQPLVIPYTGSYLSDLATGDADGDGDADLIASDIGTNTIVVLPSNGSGFGDAVVSALPFAPTQIAAGDFTGDGGLDIAVRSYSASVLVLLEGDGEAGFTETSRIALPASASGLFGGRIDDDAFADVLVVHGDPARYDFYFGHAGGTFENPVSVTGPAVLQSDIAFGDLTGDGNADIVTCAFSQNTVTVYPSSGWRTFASPVSYDVSNGARSGNPLDVLTVDANDDGDLDVVVTLANQRSIGTLRGNGDGTLRPVEITPFRNQYDSPIFPHYATAADFTGDGRMDITVSGSSSLTSPALALFRNASGEIRLNLASKYPTISAGQATSITVTGSLAEGVEIVYGNEPPWPTGTMSLKNGSSIIGTAPVQEGAATFEVTTLPVGTHNLTAHFPGDDEYREGTSLPFTQRVIAEKTTTTLTNSATASTRYGQEFILSSKVTSPLPDPLHGHFWLYTNGQRSEYAQSAPESYWYTNYLPPGTYEFQVSFEGTPTQPPSTSAVVTHVITKGKPVVNLHVYETHIRHGSQPEVTVDLRADPHGGTPGGYVRLYSGQTLLERKFADNRCCSGGMSVYFTLPVLAEGVHELRAVYEGDTNFDPGESAAVKLTVLPATGFVVDVTAWNGDIRAQGFLPDFSGYYRIYRRIGTGAWTQVQQTSYPSYYDSNVPFNTAYAYRMEAYNWSHVLVVSSNVDVAMRVAFTDEPQGAATPIKALHVGELVAATNSVRAAAGLAPLAIADAAQGQRVRSSHIAQLRTALNAARTALGAPAIAFPADGASGAVIRKRHIQELRDAFR